MSQLTIQTNYKASVPAEGGLYRLVPSHAPQYYNSFTLISTYLVGRKRIAYTVISALVAEDILPEGALAPYSDSWHSSRDAGFGLSQTIADNR